MHEKILELASAIASPAEGESALLEELCTASAAELTGRLHEGMTTESCGALFPLAAAMLAAASFLSCRGEGAVEQFTAGEISLRMGGGKEADAGELRRQAVRMLGPFLRDEGFAFLGVQG